MPWLTRLLLGGCVVLGAACSDDGVPGTPGAAEGGTAPTGTGSDPAAEDAGGQQTGGLDGSGGAGTSGDDPGSNTAGDTDGAGSTGGSSPPPACMARTECMLVDDCCTCGVFHMDATDVPVCPERECDQSACDVLMLPPDIGLACDEQDACAFESRNCSDALVLCESLPPSCLEGTLPEVTPDGICWTNACIPIEACDGVPSCDFCTEQEVCVSTTTMAGAIVHDCQPLPRDCDGAATCACVPDACTPPFQCTEVATGLGCDCLNC